MAVTGTKTVRDIVTMALRKAGVAGFNETPAAEDAAAARDELNVMLKAWQNMGHNLWTKTGGSLTLTTAAEYTLSPERPLSILSARFKRVGIEMPMEQMTREEYDALPDKATTGTPTQFYYDRQREAARLYIWPVLSAASGETIEFTYQREIEDVADLGDVIDVPGEWWDAVILNLAVRVAESLPGLVMSPTLPGRAQAALGQAAAFDREGSVFFAGPWAD